MTSGIYIILNSTNHKFYLGSAKDIGVRWSSHKRDLNKKKHHNMLLQGAWNKYGSENFAFLVIEECDQSIRLELEQSYLDLLFPFRPHCYNLSKTAAGGSSPKISRCGITLEQAYGLKRAQEIKTILSNAAKGRAGHAWTGKKRDDETKRKIAEKNKGNYHGIKNREVIIDSIEYASVYEASRQLGIQPVTITVRLKSNSGKFDNYYYKSIGKIENVYSNKRAKVVSIFGVKYKSIDDASHILNVAKMTIRNRALSNSESFTDYYFL